MSKKKSKILMKWADLMPGDKLKYNPEFVKKILKRFGLFYNYKADNIIKKKDVIFTISSVKTYADFEQDNYILIEFKNSGLNTGIYN